MCSLAQRCATRWWICRSVNGAWRDDDADTDSDGSPRDDDADTDGVCS